MLFFENNQRTPLSNFLFMNAMLVIVLLFKLRLAYRFVGFMYFYVLSYYRFTACACAEFYCFYVLYVFDKTIPAATIIR